MRIKCPNCQNTMTFTLMWEDTDGYSITHTKEYECKCGCTFEVNFIAEKPKILKKPIEKYLKVCYNKYCNQERGNKK